MAILIFILLRCLTAFANDLYVTTNGAGLTDGSTWSNAFAGFADISFGADTNQCGPGSTVWVAGGLYDVLILGGSGSFTNPFRIVRVVSTNPIPVSSPGWQTNYDSIVTFSRVVSSGKSHWILDGQVPYNGMCISNPSVSVGHGLYLSNAAFTNIAIKNLTISGAVASTNVSGVEDNRGIHFNGSTYNSSSGMTIQCCIFQQYPTLILTININDILIEHCKFMKNYRGATDIHPNIWAVAGSTNVVFRFNEITEFLTEGIMMDFVSVNDSACDNWDIYGNLWHNSLAGWYGRAVESQYKSQYRIRIYNNTFVNLDYTILLANGGSWGAGCSLQNNIIYNCGSPGGFGQTNDDYNASDASPTGSHSITGISSAVFVSYAVSNYNIVSNAVVVNTGTNLGNNYATDYAGNTRGAEWDIGAYEYVPTVIHRLLGIKRK